MQQFIALFFLGSMLSVSWASGPEKKVDCQRVADSARVYCDTLNEYQCSDLHSCLKRRDTCLQDGKAPNDKESCEEYNSCLQEISPSFSQRCEFSWSEDPLKGNVRCMDKRGSWWRSTSCPGYTKGDLLRAFITKESKERDVNFDCSLVRDEYESAQKHCREAIADYETSCLIGEEDKVKVGLYKKNLSCEFFDNFKTYKRGQFALERYSKAVDDSKRKKAPNADDSSSAGGEWKTSIKK